MDKDIFVFEVNYKNFDQSVLQNSHKIPVVVEFMGVWSGPCIAMEHIFTNLAREFPEKFIFAKVDIDEQPELVKTYNIENVPTTLVFQNGETQRTEVGELKENEARTLLKDFGIYHQSDVMREQARQMHLSGDSGAAIIKLSEAIKLDPSNLRVVMDTIQVFLDIGEFDQANDLFSRLPSSSHESDMGKALNGQLVFANLVSKIDDINVLQQRLANTPDDLAARFDMALHQVVQYKYEEAIDNLFYIQKENADFKDGAAKEMIITITNMIAPVNNEMAQSIRRRLANEIAE